MTADPARPDHHIVAGPSAPTPQAGAAPANGSPSSSPLFEPSSVPPVTPAPPEPPPALLLEPEKPRRRRRPFVAAASVALTAILFLLLGAGYALLVGKQRFEAPGPSATERVVNIPPRSGVRDIANLLEREGVIDQPWTFVAGVFALGARDDLKAGEYQFAAHASLKEVVRTMAEGKVVQHQITIPEGLTSEQVVARILENPELIGTLKEIPKEGSLLPETYRYTRGTARDVLVQRMQHSMRRVLQEAWEKRSPDLPLKSAEQLLVLASIVEKETGKPEERPRVAGVFVNRLKQRMKLESDPTIIYGLVGGKGTLGRPIMKSEIRQPTPYNTYVIEGLPPAPIANPGRAAIEATANPARTKDLYFVADGTGGHAFSETLAEHTRGVSRLRQLEQQAREGAGQDAAAPPGSGSAQNGNAAAPAAGPSASASAPSTPPPAASSPTPPTTPVGASAAGNGNGKAATRRKQSGGPSPGANAPAGARGP